MDQRSPFSTSAQNRQLFPEIAHVPRWYQKILWITSPAIDSFDSTIKDQEKLRRSRILSVLHWVLPLVTLLSMPIMIDTPEILPALAAIIGLAIVSGFLNRFGYVTIGGLVYVLAIDIGLALLLILPGEVSAITLPDFDLMAISILFAALILPKAYIPLVSLFNILLIIGIFLSVPINPILWQEVVRLRDSNIYSAYFDPILLQISGGIIGFLGALSVERALVRASRAEELAEARSYINEQNRLITEQKERLEQGITILKETQSRVANGDYSARAQLQESELFPLAVSFNLLVERLSKLGTMEQEYRRLRQSIQVVLDTRNRYAYGDRSGVRVQTGTQLDQILQLIERYYLCQDMITQSVTLIDELRVVLQRQQHGIAHLEQNVQRSPRTDVLGMGSGTEHRTRRDLEEVAGLAEQARQANALAMQRLRALAQMMQLEMHQGHD